MATTCSARRSTTASRQIDLKQKLNAAEAAGDLAATQAVSEEMAALNEQCTEFWEQEVRMKRNPASTERRRLRTKNVT